MALGALVLSGATGCISMELPAVGGPRGADCALSMVAEFEGAGRADERTDLWMVFVDVGHGDATWIRTPGIVGETARDIVIDAGDDGWPEAEHVPDGGAALRALFDRGGLSIGAPIDVLVLTHADKDHYGGARRLVAEHPIALVIEPGRLASSATWQALQRELGTMDGLIRRRPAWTEGIDPFRRGLRLTTRWGRGLTAELLAADVDAPDDNGSSIVLKIGFAGAVVMLMADADSALEGALVGRTGPVDILRVAHHGGQGTSTAPFIDRALPIGRVGRAVISAGEWSGLPDASVVERLRARVGGEGVFRTDRLDAGRSRRDAAGDDHILARIRADTGRIALCYLDPDPKG